MSSSSSTGASFPTLGELSRDQVAEAIEANNAAFLLGLGLAGGGEDLGYRIGVLGASAMGVPVYRRLGFEEYCRIAVYEWPHEAWP